MPEYHELLQFLHQAIEAAVDEGVGGASLGKKVCRITVVFAAYVVMLS